MFESRVWCRLKDSVHIPSMGETIRHSAPLSPDHVVHHSKFVFLVNRRVAEHVG